MKERELEAALKGKLEGSVRFDRAHKALYATDSSNYRQVPIGVVTPKSEEDIVQTVATCREFDVPILSRGGGTSLAGQCCNVAVVMDMSRHYNRLLELNPDEKYAIVEPGLVLDDLRNAAEKFHLTFGPDPSTHSRCTLGGMIGNNSCGVHALMAGKTEENVEQLRILLYDGTQLTVGATPPETLARNIRAGGRQGQLYRDLNELSQRYSSEIRKRFPQIPRRVSGYNLPELLPENGFHLARALVGTESTCATTLRAKVRLVHSPPERFLAVIGFKSLEASGHAIPAILEHHPIGLEGIDHFLVENIRIKHFHESSLRELPDGNAWLLVELGADRVEELREASARLQASARKLKDFSAVYVMEDRAAQKKLWEVREAGLGATAYVPGQDDTWEGWEDSAVPPDKVGEYLSALQALYKKFAYHGALYGHFGQGCIHTRINFDLVTADGIKKYRRFIEEAARLVTSFGGSLSGEHGDGQSKAEFLPIMFGDEIVKAFAEFKAIFDPTNKMNPGKIVHPFKNTENLRLGTAYTPWSPKTHFQFPDDHGDFSRSALRCVGVGACRKEHAGVMCPSYMVTREEKHSTRGRAHLLFEMLRGEVLQSSWRNPEVKEALDLCFACKGCKGECPVNVDMATYKAEFLAHYYRGRLRPRSAYAMGQIRNAAGVASIAPNLANFFTQNKWTSVLAKKLAGIDPRRSIPKFAAQPFRRTFVAKPNIDRRPEVLLWVDTFNNFFHPAVAQAGARVLEAAGFHVSLPKKQYCCGRPLYDYGFLNQAKRYLRRIMTEMRDDIRAGTPLVFLEPSCAAVFRDELTNLFPHDLDAQRLKTQSLMLSEFLVERAPQFAWPKIHRQAFVHGHCHHQSVLRFEQEKIAMAKMELDVKMPDAGCCGMAGSFGFEQGHYEISQKVGERVLFPELRKCPSDAFLIADGFSCREQIQQATGLQAFHLAQVIDQFAGGPP